jgi:nicotinate-nucleotide adenylyltransferase
MGAVGAAWPEQPPLLLFGGTFDPVHEAHLSMARQAMRCLQTERLVLLPAGDPPHRPAPGACAADRLQMLRLACADDPRLRIDERELRRKGRSYSVLSLRELRAECGPDRPLVMVLGSDAGAGLERWYHAEALAALCHLLIMARPQAVLPSDMLERLGWRRVERPSDLLGAAAGRCCLFRGELSGLSASAVREALRRDDPRLSHWLPAAVLDFIRSKALYREPEPL